jgi:hypothetical protein
MTEGSNLVVMRSHEQLSVPEVARRLGIAGEEVYEQIFSGELDGGPGPDGAVYVSTDALEAYERRTGRRASKR